MRLKHNATCGLFGLAVVVCLMSCAVNGNGAESRLRTDLGASNAEVAARFEAYKQKVKHCVYETDADYRVILAGFGPFRGMSVNTSSLVAMNFVRFSNDQASPSLTLPQILSGDHDGIISQGVVLIHDKKVAVCAVSTSVIWDLAGAIYLDEANRFKPDLIIMSGMDGTSNYRGTWENHTENEAKGVAGYEADGRPSVVTPNAGSGQLIEIVPHGPKTYPMTWNAKNLVAVTSPILLEQMPQFSVQTSANETPGEYLCNNVSYVVIAGVEGKKLSLAGGQLVVQYDGLSQTKAGFFHYPWLSPQDKEAVRVWTNVLSATIHSEMEDSGAN